MVLQHVAHRAGIVVVIAAAFDADGFGDGDLHLLDVARVPQRLEQRIAEAQRQQVLHAFLAEVVVDAKDAVFVEHPATPSLIASALARSLPMGFSSITRVPAPAAPCAPSAPQAGT